MNEIQLSLFAGALLSLLFSYVPKLDKWFDKQDSVVKRLIMAACLLTVSIAVFGAACANLSVSLLITATCDQNGAVSVATNFILALMANQTAYQITKRKNV